MNDVNKVNYCHKIGTILGIKWAQKWVTLFKDKQPKQSYKEDIFLTSARLEEEWHYIYFRKKV